MKALNLVQLICAFMLIIIGSALILLTDSNPTPIEFMILGVLLCIAAQIDD